MKKHTEVQFEDAIVNELVTKGGYAFVDYNQGAAEGAYNVAKALDPDLILSFIEKTQAKPWASLKTIHGEAASDLLIEALSKELDTKGTLKVLRQGFKCYGKKFRVAYFAPSNAMNPDTQACYEANVLSVTRQLYYSSSNRKSLDLALFLNGLPIATLELKNPLSGQNVEHAKKQYKRDRDPKELLFQFKKRALVHFAVDPDLVYMTTRLSGDKTVFLPFNLGHKNHAGNPLANDGGYRTSYLWREVLQRDSLLDILGRFMHLEIKERRILTDKGVRKVSRETMIFPRYHQLDAVWKLVADTSVKGTGHNYLVQHSAGSGKSNSIAWLAHRLSNLHNKEDAKVFDSVVVVTDRRVLDQQLQNTIYQFDHRQGVVEKINEDTRQLVKALSAGTPIIITTLQKFPFVAETLERLREDQAGLKISTRDKQFAVIVDEAHSSQSGEGAMELKGVLNHARIEEYAAEYSKENGEDEDPDQLAGVVREMMKRSKQDNLSFYAFTATPKYKTKHLFDEPGPDGKSPFHHYSMRQAIEERFILDVLKNYTTYETYYRIVQSTDKDQNVFRKKAARALARILTHHPHNIATKTEVMVEHFRTHTRHKIGGRAKAMVVTDSRLSAVRYKQAFDKYIKEKGYKDVKTLVAFSGTVEDPEVKDKSWTEVSLNEGVKESELPEKFDSPDYQVLLVAEKYQTGFDQPLLHTMYVDKKLTGLQAVQTLSRLNRTCAGKEDTFVLDFRNKPEEIFKAFKPYYEDTPAEPLTDAQHLYRLQHQIDELGLIFEEEIIEFCGIYFQNKRKESKQDHAEMNGVLNKVVERFKELQEEAREEAKALFVNFRNMYGFLSQVIPYQDSDLEKLYTYLRFLLTKLPRREEDPNPHLEDEVELRYYRLQKINEGRIDLSHGESKPLKGPSDVGTGQEDKLIALSELIDILNKRFGTEFTQADQLFFDQIEEEVCEDEGLKQAAQANNEEDFRYVFEKAFEGLVINRMEGNDEITERLLADGDFRDLAIEYFMHKVYKRLRADKSS